MTALRLWSDPYENRIWNDPFINMIDRFFETPSFIEKGYTKRSNIMTTDEDYKIQLAVPGVTKEDVKISIEDSVVSISHDKKETDDKTYYFTTAFKKQYSLPDDCDEENISSKMENGILEIIIPRISKKKLNERFIEVK
jgi:HSP20 family protein